MSFLNFRNQKIAFSDTGKGMPLLLLHGYLEDRSMWEDFISTFNSSSYRIITMDLPGFGESEIEKAYSISEMADMVDHLVEHLHLQRFVFIGHSMGGYVALAYAKKYSNKLAGLGLFHSHVYSDSAEAKAKRDRQIEFINENGTIHYVKQIIPNLFPKGYPRFHKQLVDKLIFNASKYPAKGLINALTAMKERADHSNTFKHLPFPTLVIHGTNDEIIEDEQAYQQALLPAICQLEILKGVGHMGMFESSRSCVKIIKNFVELCYSYQLD